eukprot:1741065-Pyramimonas_sp.AAC.2
MMRCATANALKDAPSTNLKAHPPNPYRLTIKSELSNFDPIWAALGQPPWMLFKIEASDGWFSRYY